MKRFFDDVDMHHQAILLTTALILIENYYAKPSLAIEKYLQYLGTKHHVRGIPRESYQHWIDAMLDTLQRFHGSDWDTGLEGQWRGAIHDAADVMLDGYQEHFHV